jgi:hypothetical protein
MDNATPPGGGDLWRLLQGETEPEPDSTPPDSAKSAPSSATGASETEAPPAPVIPPRTPKAPPGVRRTTTPDQGPLAEPDAEVVNPGSDNYIAQDSSGPVGPVSTDTSQLQKILSASTEEDFEYRPQGVAVEDGDAAVRAFHKGSMEVIHCKIHPERESVAQCPVCQAFYCQDCLIVRRSRLICRDCADAEYAPTEEEIFAAQEMGLDAPPADTQIGEKERPEFELGSTIFGGEGKPSNPFMQLLAWAIDFGLVRGAIFLFVMFFGSAFEHNSLPLLHILDGKTAALRQQDVIQTLLLGGLGNGTWLRTLPLLIGIDFLWQLAGLLFFNRTVGMSWAGLRIVTEWGDYAPFTACLIRSLVYAVLMGIVAIVPGAFMPDFRGLHDMAAGTIAINYNGLKRVDLYDTIAIKR